EGLNRLRPVDEDDHLRRRYAEVLASVAQGEVTFAARAIEPGQSISDSFRERRVGLMRMRCRSAGVRAVIEPKAGGVALEAMNAAALCDLDRTQFVERHGQQHARITRTRMRRFTRWPAVFPLE